MLADDFTPDPRPRTPPERSSFVAHCPMPCRTRRRGLESRPIARWCSASRPRATTPRARSSTAPGASWCRWYRASSKHTARGAAWCPRSRRASTCATGRRSRRGFRARRHRPRRGRRGGGHARPGPGRLAPGRPLARPGHRLGARHPVLRRASPRGAPPLALAERCGRARNGAARPVRRPRGLGRTFAAGRGRGRRTAVDTVAETRDDAMGEVFDKVGKRIGLPFPGGPLLDALAERGDARAHPLPVGSCGASLDFSFSGLKSRALLDLDRMAKSWRPASWTARRALDRRRRARRRAAAVGARSAGGLSRLGGEADPRSRGASLRPTSVQDARGLRWRRRQSPAAARARVVGGARGGRPAAGGAAPERRQRGDDRARGAAASPARRGGRSAERRRVEPSRARGFADVRDFRARPPAAFPFRPWVRSTCRSAMLWGMGVILLLGGVAWWLRDPSEGFFGKAFTVLLGYTVLFWASLLKIWWTAGKPAIVIDAESLAYQPLQYFRPRLRFDRVIACGPRPGTESSIRDRGRGPRARAVLEPRGGDRQAPPARSRRSKAQAEGLERAAEGWSRAGVETAAG